MVIYCTAHWSRSVVVDAVQYDGTKKAEVPGCLVFLDALNYSVDRVPTPFNTLRFETLPHLAPYHLAAYHLALNHLAP
jgi:hypothetical protein